MKINQDWQIALNKDRNSLLTKAQNHSSFGQIFEKHEHKLHFNQLTKLLSEIEYAGKRLHRSRTFRDLAGYKNLVKDFVHEAVEFGLNLKQSQDWSSSGQSRMLKIVEQIDQELLLLTEKMINHETPSMAILDKIGEIKGLLIDLYK